MGYDVTPLVTARRMLLHETHHLAEIFEQVYTPSDQSIRQLALDMPQKITCLWQIQKTKIMEREEFVYFVDVVVGTAIVYLGTILSARQAEANYVQLLKMYKNHLSHLVEQLRQKGPMAIMPERYRRTIPIHEGEVSENGIRSGIRKFFLSQHRSLADVPVDFMDRERSLQIYGFVRAEAARTAVRQTAEEKRKILIEDIKF